MGVALRTVTNNGDGLTFDQGQITIFIVKNFHSELRLFLCWIQKIKINVQKLNKLQTI
jgi:hypothetical protein